MSSFVKLFLVLTALVLPAAAAAAGQRVDDREIVIRGCVNVAGRHAITPNRSLLVWSKGDLMLSNVVTEMPSSGTVRVLPNAAVGTAGTSQTIFYWLDSTEDLNKHVGEVVEITGKLGKEIDQAKIEVDPKDHYTEIEFDSNGHEVKARVPAGMLGETSKTDYEYHVLIRDVDVKKVRVLSRTCAAQ